MTTPDTLDSGLPEYSRPPIVEVAASIEFANIRDLNAVRLGMLWSRFRGEYPRTEQHPPLPSSAESFDPSKGGRVEFSVETTFPIPRLWFLREDGTRLIQLQSNRIVANWRQMESGQSYLRYSSLKTMLRDALEKLQSFLAEEKLGPIKPEQVELTYVNHISAGARGSARHELSHYLRCWNGVPKESELGAEEATSFRTQFVLRREEKRAARLFVELESGYAANSGLPIYVLNLAARGAPDSPSVEAAFEFLDDEHRWIVNGFTQLTTGSAHSLWERTK